jgi:hypothetical protein
MTEDSEFTQVGFIALNSRGEWKVDYISYATGDATLQTALGTQLGPLVSGLEKNKKKYMED